MLLIYQTGSVKVGEVVRYTVTYTPSADRILPSPRHLHLRIRNTCAVALRAAFVHGPYTLSVAAYPSNFDPHERFAPLARRYGVPEFEPLLKAGGVWECKLVVPEHIRQSAGVGRDGFFGTAGLGSGVGLDGATGSNGRTSPGVGGRGGEEQRSQEQSATWIIEIASQVIFSASAAVGFEVVLARDEKGLNIAGPLTVLSGQQGQAPVPGKLADHRHAGIVGLGTDVDGEALRQRRCLLQDQLLRHQQPKGVFSRAVTMLVDDTASLWNTPPLPGLEETPCVRKLKSRDGHPDSPAAVETENSKNLPPGRRRGSAQPADSEPQAAPKKQAKVHLVILTHGIHSNLGADMLFLKESIDKAAKKARADRKLRLARERAARQKTWDAAENGSCSSQAVTDSAGESQPDAEEGQRPARVKRDEEDGDDDDDDEQVIVRGFAGNATRTERGIKYLGKRLARYVLAMTYPDQPFLPSKKAATEAMAHALHGASKGDVETKAAHKHSSVYKAPTGDFTRPFRITSISFIAHSLGGLVQTYAVAYIQKHSPQFFDRVRPINFVAMASPFLGLSNENPLYVRFALDFGLVGRTGQDLGLTWRPPTIARSGWGALVNLGESAQKKMLGDSQPESKPLLRILPTGPAHTALKKFRNRTVYSNVVNDGIVPLRTSCLLFLDWQGLGRVEKARREAGLVETVVGFGWAELTGANAVAAQSRTWEVESLAEESDGGTATPSGGGDEHRKDRAHDVPQPDRNATLEDDRQSLRSVVVAQYGGSAEEKEARSLTMASTLNTGPFAGFFNFFRSSEPPRPAPAEVASGKQAKIYHRSQTLRLEATESTVASSTTSSTASKATTGHELPEDDASGRVSAPPRTTIFESASDLMNPKVPSVEFLIDPSKRPRTIFHDRVYHPSDIPPPPLKKRTTSTGSSLMRRTSFRRTTSSLSTRSGPLSRLSQTTNTANTTASGTGGGTGAGTAMTDSRSSSPYPPPAQVQHQDSLASARDYDDAPNTDPDRDLRDVVDSGGMRVEEKIARAYHRDMSWRKVLVKLEPDAHNNMVVRRMFANAFGWPVIKHICDAHFSDSATARVRDDEELGVERAKRLGEAPDRYGAETTEEGVNIKGGAGVEAEDGKGVAKENGVPLVVVGSGKEISDGGGGSVDESRGRPAYRTDSEAREALDSVSDLPPSSATSAEAGGGGRPELRHSRSQDGASSRRDSVAWSEADWADSGDDSDDDVYHDHVAHGGAHGGAIKTTTLTAPDTGGSASEGTRSPSPSVWSWTEKIVGRGAMAARASSPRKTVPGETPGATAQGGGGPAPK